MRFMCPVCLTDSLDEPYQHYSYDLCRTCGVEFGYDDAINREGWTQNDWAEKADKLIAERHAKLRKIWQDAGSLTWWEETKKPGFTCGVPWFQKYWANHPDEYENWQNDLSSGWIRLKERPAWMKKLLR